MSRPLLIGITGTIGSGKSFVGDLLTQRGFNVIDTDEVVHSLFASDRQLQQAIATRFGNRIVSGGTVNRQALGSMVFADDKARKDLEAIVHPATIKECDRLIAAHNDEKVLFFLVPLLFEAGLAPRYDQIWTVVADEKVIRERLKSRSGLNDQQISERLAAQMSQAEKSARAHRTIDNSHSAESTKQQLDALLTSIE